MTPKPIWRSTVANKFRFHVLGLVHTAINKDYICCAYSQKLKKFCDMVVPRGHHVTLYSNEGADVPCENVQIFSEEERAHFFGSHDRKKLYDLKWDSNEPYWQRFNDRCIEALRPRVKKGDFILTAAGNVARPIGDAFPGSYSGNQQTVCLAEPFVGYYGIFSRYWAAESHAHREWLMGSLGCKVENNDTAVIENYWDLRDFEVVDLPHVKALQTKGPYYIFVGRIIPDKGWGVAVDVCRDIGARLILCGQGDPGPLPDHVEFFGPANVQERAALVTGAIGAFCATHFREPFGGTAVEAQLCGTPAITTDHGAFTQTVEERWRCASHREFIIAARLAMTLTPSERAVIRTSAESKYSLEAIAPKFERFFQRIIDRFGAGWYAKEPVRVEDIVDATAC
jgi:glycosyltransferase involved in cell wall biosynthesis